MIKEGVRLNHLNKQIAKLKAIRQNMMRLSPDDHRIVSISDRIEKLEKEKSNWEGLYAIVQQAQDPISMIETATIQAPPAQVQSQTNNSTIFNKDFVNFIKSLENAQRVGFTNGLWHPHASYEGGMPTIAYGHKIEQNYLDHYENGISDSEANKLLIMDITTARKRVDDYIQRVYHVKLQLSPKQEEMLTEFSFNLGGLDQFPKFVDAVLKNDWSTAAKEYKRYSQGRELTHRNHAFYNRYLKSELPVKASVHENLVESIKSLIVEGAKEKALEDFISKIIKGTEWEGKVFIAGGYVRDEFMGKDPKDLDILVNAPNGGIEFAKWITRKVGAYRGGPDVELPPEPQPPPEHTGGVHGGYAPGEAEEQWEKEQEEYAAYQAKHAEWVKLSQQLEAQSAGSNPVIFPRFGTAKFNLRGVVHNGVDLSEIDVEAVMPRKEQYTAGSRKPKVTGGELKDDVERRDFTVNSLLKDLTTGEILDLTGMGKDDIKAGIVRTPLNPDKIFTDDPLRMLRAIRFAVKYNWKLPLFMMRGLKKNAPQLQNISQERIRDELNKMLVTGHPSKAIEILRITGLLRFVIPELIPLIKLQQNKFHKEDAFNHTLDVLSKTQPVLLQRLMALFHDIGKFATKSVTDTGIHFYGHEKEGAEIARNVMRRLKYPSELIDAVAKGVQQHMRLKHGGPEATNVEDKTLRSFVSELGETLEDTLDVIHADNIAHSEAASMPNQIAKIRERLKTLEVRKKIEGQKENLPITGEDILNMGVPRGPMVGKVKSVIKKAVLKNPNLSREEAFKLAGKVVATLTRRGFLKEGVINEGSELPPELAKEAQLVTKAAIGWIYAPFFRAAYLRLDTREKEHDAVMEGLRKFIQKVKKFHETAPHGSKKDTSVVMYDTFSWENVKKNRQRIAVHIEKDQHGTTIVTTKPRYGELEGVFYEYGEWADPDRDNPEMYYQRLLKQTEESWAKSKEYKDDYIYGFISSLTTCKQYKSLRQPTAIVKSPLNPDGDKLVIHGYPYVIEMAMNFEERTIPVYFNVVKYSKDIKVKHPDHESGNPENAYVYMTLVTDYLTDFRGLDGNAVKKKILTAEHEAIHVYQDIRKAGIQTGLPKRHLQHLDNPNVRGIDAGGKSLPDSPHKDPDDEYNRVKHSFRSVEFKSNLINMIRDFQRTLGENLPRSEWEKGFKWLVDESIGKRKDWNWRQDFKQIFPHSFSWEISLTRKNLEDLYTSDRPKFRQYIKEIYKMLFVTPDASQEWSEIQRQQQYQKIRQQWLKKIGQLSHENP